MGELACPQFFKAFHTIQHSKGLAILGYDKFFEMFENAVMCKQ
jgi:hypothetical protein